MPRLEEKKQEELEEFRKKEAEELTQILSRKYKLPYLDLSRMTIDLDALKILNEEMSREAQLVVFQKVGKKLQVGVRSPELPSAKKVLAGLEDQGYQLQLFLVSENSLKKAWARYPEVPAFVKIQKGVVEISNEKIQEFFSQIQNLESLKSLLNPLFGLKDSRQASEILEAILAGGLNLEASDIHLEPEEEKVRIRLRLDGVLEDLIFIERKIYNLLLSRIKLVSELKLNIHNRAQDGRFTIRVKENDIEVRTSALPGPYGESIVLRILNPKTISLTFKDLGMQPRLLEIMALELKKPNGMILTTGPTGSGKTTTLYAFVKEIRTPGIKIITIEDPIEYHLKGISQTQVEEEKGYDFSNGLKSILRQDPDVILVGEIRDLDTAETAMHASLTGHLVFSTLHTNNAAGTIPRLIDLGVKPNIISPAINVAMAQRLVRKLCPACRKKTPPTKKEMNLIKKVTKKPAAFIFRAAGCSKCNNTGYKGRVGVFEAILIDQEMERLILKNPSENEIIEKARKQNIPAMEEDAVLKIIEGITSFEELERVLGSPAGL